MAARLPASLLALVFLASTADCSLAQTLWNAGVGDWSASGNWTLAAPGAITDAQINNGGTAQILAPGALAFNVTLGTSPFTSGSLAVQGGQAQFSSVLAVGAHLATARSTSPVAAAFPTLTGASVENSAGLAWSQPPTPAPCGTMPATSPSAARPAASVR